MAASTWPRPGAPNHLRGFFFQRRQGKIDWRKLGRVNLHALVAQVNVEVLNDNVDHVTFADITEDDISSMNAETTLKLIRLMQLIIEYLLNMQNHLLALGDAGKQREEKWEEEVKRREIVEKEKEEKIKTLKKEKRYMKKLLLVYETNNVGKKEARVLAKLKRRQLRKFLADSNETEEEKRLEGPIDLSKCRYCSAKFKNKEFLQRHINRRHNPPPKMYDSSAKIKALEDVIKKSADDHKRQMEELLKDNLAKLQPKPSMDKGDDRKKWEAELKANQDQGEKIIQEQKALRSMVSSVLDRLDNPYPAIADSKDHTPSRVPSLRRTTIQGDDRWEKWSLETRTNGKASFDQTRDKLKCHADRWYGRLESERDHNSKDLTYEISSTRPLPLDVATEKMRDFSQNNSVALPDEVSDISDLEKSYGREYEKLLRRIIEAGFKIMSARLQLDLIHRERRKYVSVVQARFDQSQRAITQARRTVLEKTQTSAGRSLEELRATLLDSGLENSFGDLGKAWLGSFVEALEGVTGQITSGELERAAEIVTTRIVSERARMDQDEWGRVEKKMLRVERDFEAEIAKQKGYISGSRNLIRESQMSLEAKEYQRAEEKRLRDLENQRKMLQRERRREDQNRKRALLEAKAKRDADRKKEREMKASALVEKRDRDIKEGIHFRNEQIKTVGIIASMAGEAKSKHKVYPYAPGSKVLVAKYPLQRTELEKGELDGSDMVMRMEDPEILEKRLAEIEPQMWQDHHEAVKTNLQEAMRDYRKSKGMADAREKTELDIKKLTNHVLRLEEAEREARAKILRMKRKESDGPEGDIDHNRVPHNPSRHWNAKVGESPRDSVPNLYDRDESKEAVRWRDDMDKENDEQKKVNLKIQTNKDIPGADTDEDVDGDEPPLRELKESLKEEEKEEFEDDSDDLVPEVIGDKETGPTERNKLRAKAVMRQWERESLEKEKKDGNKSENNHHTTDAEDGTLTFSNAPTPLSAKPELQDSTPTAKPKHDRKNSSMEGFFYGTNDVNLSAFNSHGPSPKSRRMLFSPPSYRHRDRMGITDTPAKKKKSTSDSTMALEEPDDVSAFDDSESDNPLPTSGLFDKIKQRARSKVRGTASSASTSARRDPANESRVNAWS